MEKFQVYGDFQDGALYGNGHINDTYRVRYHLGGRPVHYLLQRINHAIFKKPLEVQENIHRVTQHLLAKFKAQGYSDSSRRTRIVIPTKRNELALQCEDQTWWRAFIFIEDVQTVEVMQNTEQAFLVGEAFARFQNQLADLPAPRLHETIPHFHNTVKRYEAFQAALQADAFNRAKEVRSEIAFFEARADSYGRLLRRHEKGELPERITHNDTKLNNILLDIATGEGVCVIDLDTVMPGLALYDFGDMCRTGTATTTEDDLDINNVRCRLEMFEALTRGYCSAAQFLVQAEKEELAFSAQLITLTIGLRFLTDYLLGDTYFRIHRPAHNLDRCRTQQRMVLSMEEQAEAMERIVMNAERL
jgi:Ser/Thr protein kinase RdoA (MazF antagonist)